MRPTRRSGALGVADPASGRVATSPAPQPDRARAGRSRTAWRVGYVAALTLLVALRLHANSPLWLDETLSVNISRLPLHQLFAALREDGSPPLYYLLLHYWIAVFGTGTDAVRALTVLMSLVTLPVMFVVARRLAGTGVAQAATLILAASPFAIRYATETRMYTLLVLLSLLGVWALERAWQRPSVGRLAVVSLISGLLALTHYWALFLLAACGAVLAWRRLRYAERVSGRLLAGVVGGVVVFAPWVPNFLFQVRHTGTPWAKPPTFGAVLLTVQGWTGTGDAGAAVFALYLGLTVVAALPWLLAARSAAGGPRVVLVLLGAVFGTVALGVVASELMRSGYALRYSAPVLPLMILLLALALTLLDPRVRRVTLALLAVFGILADLNAPFAVNRTQAKLTAALVRGRAAPGDLVIYCPDQLGPAVNRLLPSSIAQVTYPSLGSPERIDWVDYAQRNEKANPLDVADRISASTTGRIWLVRADGYRTFDTQCADLDGFLTDLRGGRLEVEKAKSGWGERQSLIRFPAPASPDRAARVAQPAE